MIRIFMVNLPIGLIYFCYKKLRAGSSHYFFLTLRENVNIFCLIFGVFSNLFMFSNSIDK